MTRVVAQAQTAVGTLRFEDALDHRRAARQSAIGAACLVAFGMSCLLAPEAMGIWFQRNVLLSRHVEWPQLTHLQVDGVEDGRLIHPSGDDLQINVTATGQIPRSVDFEYEPHRDATDDGTLRAGELQLFKHGERDFRGVFPQLRRALRARAVGGDAVTEWFDVVLVQRPRVTQVQMAIAPPAYTGLSLQTLRAGQTVAEALRGSEVRIEVETNKPIAQAELRRGNTVVRSLPEAAGQDRMTVHFTPNESGTYHFRLTDDYRLVNRRPVRFTVRITADRPPRVRLRIPGLGDMVTPDAVLPMSLEMTDTYGLGSAELVHRITAGAAPTTQPTTAPSGEATQPLEGFEVAGRNFSTSLNFALAPLDLEPGQRFTVFARATDQDTVGGPNIGESVIFSLRVVAPDELLAELSRREQEYRREFERLVRDQGTLRGNLLSAWNLVQIAADAAQRTAAVKAYANHARRQQALARRVVGIRGQFQRILDEMEINRVATQVIRVRLANRIIQPLETLGRKDMTAAADALGAVARSDAGVDLTAIDPEQARIVETMQRILSQMLQWEGFHEAVAILRDVIKTQSNLNRETDEELERRIQEIFGTNPAPGASKP